MGTQQAFIELNLERERWVLREKEQPADIAWNRFSSFRRRDIKNDVKENKGFLLFWHFSLPQQDALTSSSHQKHYTDLMFYR